MIKKLSLGLILALGFSVTTPAMDINSLDGGYYILKNKEAGDYTFQKNIRLTKENSNRNFSSQIKYKVESDKRTELSAFEFVEMDGETYASYKEGENTAIYIVAEKTDFALTLVNIDDKNEIIKIVLDKEYNNYEYDKYYENVKHLKDDELKRKLHDLIDNQIDLGYRAARYLFFSELDNEDGIVTCVYTAKEVKTKGIPNGSMNCEHSWPQSQFGEQSKDTKKDDVHHLFPTDSRANSKRGHVPLRNVESATWSDGGSEYGIGELGDDVFEPRDDHKGDVARALFYFSVRYNMPIDEKQEQTFREWVELDPVSEKEIRRNAGIESAQKNRNPFIDRPDFISKISDF
ncbi:MAG: endonuclease [Candidatus Muirbacterium halophilum]|nr:endonuclease [Candidatus Muirbacterium halophilum]